MMIYSTSLFAAPVMLLVWAADIYVFLASVRLILGRVAGARDSQTFCCLQHLTDGLPQRVERLLCRESLAGPTWLPWGIVMGGAIVLRHLLIGLVVLLS